MYTPLLTTFSHWHQHRYCRRFTGILFLFLTLEKLLSGIGFEDKLSYTLSVTDIICTGIYFSTALLLLCGAPKRHLLAPDIVLLAVKLYLLVSSVFSVCHATLNVGYIEKATECLFFICFLAIFFAGKIIHKSSTFHRMYPLYCLLMLTICLCVTMVFETGILAYAVGVHTATSHTWLSFLTTILNEVCLILPYFFLVITVCYIPHPHIAHKQTVRI